MTKVQTQAVRFKLSAFVAVVELCGLKGCLFNRLYSAQCKKSVREETFVRASMPRSSNFTFGCYNAGLAEWEHLFQPDKGMVSLWPFLQFMKIFCKVGLILHILVLYRGALSSFQSVWAVSHACSAYLVWVEVLYPLSGSEGVDGHLLRNWSWGCLVASESQKTDWL